MYTGPASGAIRISLASPAQIRSWSHGEVSNPAVVTVTLPCRGLKNTLDRVGKQCDVLPRRNNGAWILRRITRPATAQIEAHGPPRAFLAARLSGCCPYASVHSSKASTRAMLLEGGPEGRAPRQSRPRPPQKMHSSG